MIQNLLSKNVVVVVVGMSCLTVRQVFACYLSLLMDIHDPQILGFLFVFMTPRPART